MPERFDICVIGAGSGGLSVAAAAGLLQVPTVLIEQGEMGGDCLNYGCVPSKALLAAAHAAHDMRQAGRFGLKAVEPEVDFAAVRDHVSGVIAAIAPQDSVARFTALGVDVIKGSARFTGPDQVAVGERRINARRFIIATGSSPMVPPIPGLDQVAYFTNETFFANEQSIEHLIVIGGGPIGLEMAQAYRRLGAEVTVLEMAVALANDDGEAAGVVTTALRREGVRIFEGHLVKEVLGGEAIRVIVEDQNGGGVREIAGSHLLVAAGRKANVESLELDRAGVKVNRLGVEVDHRLRTSNRRIFAIGDVAGGLQFTHVAADHAGTVVQNALFRIPARARSKAVPWVTYTDPELAHVGLTAETAKQRLGQIEILRWPFAENDRAQCERATAGFAKIVVDRRGRVLGATIVGRGAGDLILPWVLAVHNRQKISRLASAIAPYPSFTEVSKRAAASYYTPRLFNARTRRIVRWLAKLG